MVSVDDLPGFDDPIEEVAPSDADEAEEIEDLKPEDPSE